MLLSEGLAGDRQIGMPSVGWILRVRRQLPVSFSDNYVFLVPLSSPGRAVILAPMGAAEVYVNLQACVACQACVDSSGEAQLTTLHVT